MPDSSPSTPSGRVAFLEWFDALRVADEPPVSNVEAWREAKDNVLPEAVERLRSVRLFIARGGISPGPMPEELAGFLQRIVVARRRIESGRDPLLGHYGRHGTALEPVPSGRIARFDFRAIRLQLPGDDGWWYNLARAPQSSAVSPVDPPQAVQPSHSAPVKQPSPRGYNNQDDVIARQVLREKGFGTDPDEGALWEITDAEAEQLWRIAGAEGYRLPPIGKTTGYHRRQVRLRDAFRRVTGRVTTAL